MTTRKLAFGALGVLAAGCSKAEPVPSNEQIAATVTTTTTAAAPPSTPTKATATPSGQPEYLVVQIEGMTCGGCAWEIKDKLTKLEGVQTVNVNLDGECAAIGYNPNKVGVKAVLSEFDELGYKVASAANDRLASTPDGQVQCVGSRL